MLFQSRRRQALAVAVAAAISTYAFALPSPPDGTSFRLHVEESASQYDGQSGMAPDGRHVVAWSEYGVDTARMYAALYRPDGETTGTVEIGSEDAPPNPDALRVAMAPNGHWTAVWSTHGPDVVPQDEIVYGRMLDASGAAVGMRFRLGDGMHGQESRAVTAISANGYHHAAAWHTDRGFGARAVYARPFVLDNPMADPVRVADVVDNVSPAIAMGLDDSFLVAWEGRLDEGADFNIVLGRRFDRFGVPLSPIFAISDPERAVQGVVLASGADGNFVAAWGDQSQEIYVRGLGADGVPQGPIHATSATLAEPPGNASHPAIAFDGTGGYALAYTHAAWDGQGNVQLQPRLLRFDATGPAVSSETLGDFDGSTEYVDSLALDADGDALLATTWVHGDESGVNVNAVRVQHGRGIDLAAELSGPAQADQGSGLYYAVRVSNFAEGGTTAGYNDTTGFDVEVSLPDVSTFQSYNGIGWTCEGDVELRCRYEDALAPGDTAYPLSIYAQAPDARDEIHASARVVPRHRDPDPTNNQAAVATDVGDFMPDGFVFDDPADVARATEQVSNEVVLGGFQGALPIGVENGSYSLNGGPWQTDPAEVVAGDRVRVRHVSSSAFYTWTLTHLFVGGYNEAFASRTEARDTVPATFAFTDAANVALGLSVTSDAVVVAGINDAAAVTVSGGTWSVNGGAFVATAGTVRAGDTVRVRHTASLSPETRTDTTLVIGGVADTFSSTTLARDTTPDAYAFAAQSGLARGSVATSAEATITGINSAAPVTIANGSYSIDGAAFTTAAGSIANGQRVRVRHMASAAFSTATTSTLTIGGVSSGFTSTTEAADTVPDAFTFAAQSGVARSATVTSAAITVAGINSAAPVSIAGGSYSVNGGAFTTAPGAVNAGDQVRVQHVASGSFGTATTSTLAIGGVASGFTSTTEAADAVPNAFAFADVSAKKKTVVTSAPVTIAGINTAAPVSVSGGGAKWSKNGGAFTTAAGSVVNGDVIRLQVTAAQGAGGTVNVVANVGGVADTWTVTSTN